MAGISNPGPRYNQSPAVFIRIRDLITDESVVIQDILDSSIRPTPTGGVIKSLNIQRQIGQTGSCSFMLQNRGRKYFSVPAAATANTSQVFRRPPIFYDNGFFIDARARNADGSLSSDPSIAAAKASVAGKVEAEGAVSDNAVWSYTQDQLFFRDLFLNDNTWREQNEERASLLGELLSPSSTLDAGDFASHIERIYRTTLMIEFRAQVDVDIQDSRGFWFPAFTGFIKSIGDLDSVNEVPMLEIQCADFMNFFSWAQFPVLKALNPRPESLTTRLLKKLIPSDKQQAFSTVLASKTDQQIMDIMVRVVNTSFTMEGALETAQKMQTADYTNFRKERMKSTLMRSRLNQAGSDSTMFQQGLAKILSQTNPSPTQIVGTVTPYFDRLDPFFIANNLCRRAAAATDPGLDDRFFVSVDQTFVGEELKGPLQHLQLEKVWDGPAVYMGTSECLAPELVQNPKVFRTGMPYVRDFLDLGTLEVIQQSIRTNWNIFFNEISSPMEIIGNMLPRTHADFYCTGAGWLVYKYPRLNSVPNISLSPFENDVVSVDALGGIKGQTPNELFHGKEYVMRDWTSRRYNMTEQGRYTRAVVAGDVNFVPSLGAANVRDPNSGLSFVPRHLLAALGERTLSTTEVLRTLDKDALQQVSSTLITYHNVSVNTAVFEYDIILPWEIGKTVYAPDVDFIYYLNSISINYNHGSKVSTSLTCRHGHPRRMVIPIPWLLWGAATGDAKPTLLARLGYVQNLPLIMDLVPAIPASASLGQVNEAQFAQVLYSQEEINHINAETTVTSGVSVDDVVKLLTVKAQQAAKQKEKAATSAITSPPLKNPFSLPSPSGPTPLNPTAGVLAP